MLAINCTQLTLLMMAISMVLQNWEFDERGYMRMRDACINNVPIEDSVRRLKGWEIHDKA